MEYNSQKTQKITEDEKYCCAFSYLDVRTVFKSRLFEYFDFDAKRAFEATNNDLAKLCEHYQMNLPKNYFEKIKKINPDECYNKALKDKTIKLLRYNDDFYPPLLREIPDFPVSLYYKGNLEDIDYNYNLAVIGSRKATQEAKYALASILKGLRNSNTTIVSGLAYGIDTQAHLCALEYNMKTIAVVGCGLDIVYPNVNKKLFSDIIKSHGAIFSEYPVGTKPDARNFPRRNRIITGMSKGTLVAEAQLKSGAMISAGLTLDYNRELMCIPGNILNPNTQGIYHLIENGAGIVINTHDLLNYLGWDIMVEDKNKPDDDLGEIYKNILDIVSKEAKTLDEIAIEVKSDVSSVMVSLTELELKGLIKQTNNKYYKI